MSDARRSGDSSNRDLLIPKLQLSANNIRQHIIRMLAQAGSGHSAGALGMADVFSVLYGAVLRHRPDDPSWSDRDIVLLSNGHICPVLYATLATQGYFPIDELMTLRTLGSRLQGHPHRGSLPGVENTSGPLGQGLSQACGWAAALKLQQKENHVFCLMSDAEHQEGQTWEAYLLAAHHKLGNLTAIIDRNHIQIEGTTESVQNLDPLGEKLAAFGWKVIEVDGHDHEQLLDQLQQRVAQRDKLSDQPVVMICKTIPGKGVSFMEGKFEWHGKPPSNEQATQALQELQTERGNIQRLYDST